MSLFHWNKKKEEKNKKIDDQSSGVGVGKRAVMNKNVKDDKNAENKPKKSMKELYEQTTNKNKQQRITTDENKKVIKSNDTGKKTLKKFGDAYRVLRKPLITEKVTNLGVQNKYCFEVAKDVNKIQIAEAINEVYRIKPTSVNTVKVSGKNVRHGKTKGKQKDWKKAIVTLPAGSQFNI